MYPELSETDNNTDREEKEVNTAIDRPKNYRAKLANASFGRQGRALRFRKKSSSPFRLRYFPRKPCLTGSVRRKALVVQRAAKARVFTNRINKVMNQTIITRPPMAPLHIHTPMPATRRKRTVEPKPAVKFPPRGTTGPVHISTLLNPILEICHHPDRDRLLAEFFNQ